MKRSITQIDRLQVCDFFQQGQNGHWHCRLLEYSGQPFAIIAPHARIEWTTSSAHKFLQHYWPARTGVENRLPSQIARWMSICRKQTGAMGKSPTELAPLVINRPSARLTVRYLGDGAFAALLFDEHLLELPADRLVAHGLTPRETEILRWLVQGKSNAEIATILNISVRTVSKHLERVYLRLGVENRHAAVAMVHNELKRTAQER